MRRRELPEVVGVAPVPEEPRAYQVLLSDGKRYVARMLPPARLKLHAATTGMKVNLAELVHERVLAAVLRLAPSPDHTATPAAHGAVERPAGSATRGRGRDA